ncbi:RNA polymerase sigma factor for flagellar operon FliA [Oikeobacillus pervagus]|uniref:RNA polymerase sigma factor for flagellar operon FliA n=1 Tax=Oikeobacillus pervagus TaxID=1325931 RepID=A0AAJ1WJN8_9BACI|nr:FliA/WhiG family RNA polymerase sigma factor [Oikeobacillus pervagus]MDQ0214276.1 RNA polymerase sigma factor for flagellar operon FliA [Oikeobacillus pervagus]
MSQIQVMEERKLWDLWLHSQDTYAGDLLVKKYTPLVSFHVQRIAVGLPKNVNKEEIKSLGFMGLVDALRKFDPSRDLKFDTYASFRIRGAILDGLRKEDWLPRGTREKTKKIEAKIEELEQEYLRHVTPEEVAKQLNITVEDVQQTLNEHFFGNILSIDEHVHDQDDPDGKSFAIRDEMMRTPEEYIIKEEQIKELSEQIEKLTEKEQIVLSLFYKEELTLTEIGEVLTLSTSRISQIHSKALQKLKKQLSLVNNK